MWVHSKDGLRSPSILSTLHNPTPNRSFSQSFVITALNLSHVNADQVKLKKARERREGEKKKMEKASFDSAFPPYPLAERLEPYEGFRRVRQMSLSFSTITQTFWPVRFLGLGSKYTGIFSAENGCWRADNGEWRSGDKGDCIMTGDGSACKRLTKARAWGVKYRR